MNVLLIDCSSAFLDFALRLDALGHKVKWFCGPLKKGGDSLVGEGLGLKVNDYKHFMRWADLIMVSDNAKYLNELNPYRKQGYPMIVPSPDAADLELVRKKGQECFKACGLKVMPYEDFYNYDKAIDYVKKNMKRYVSKPDGDLDKALSYVSKSPQDMVCMLERWKKNNKGAREFMLQEFVGGQEMAVGGWMGPHGFNDYVLENFEFKKMLNGDLGCNTGEQGTCIKYMKRSESKLFQQTLDKCEEYLKKMKYVGFVDIAVIIDEDGVPRPLEFTMRCGWPLFQIQQELHPDPIHFLGDLVDGIDSFTPYEDHAAGVVMTMPDFPYNNLSQETLSGFPIYGLNDENPYRDNLHPGELMFDKAPMELDGKINDAPCFVSCGNYLLVASGSGESVSDARKWAYKAVDSIDIPNSIGYRTDIGLKLSKVIPDLQEMGYAKSWKYA